MPAGLILFAHGARDGRWAEPFERLRDRVADAAPHARVVLAFLELMVPDLDAAATGRAAGLSRKPTGYALRERSMPPPNNPPGSPSWLRFFRSDQFAEERSRRV